MTWQAEFLQTLLALGILIVIIAAMAVVVEYIAKRKG